MVPLPFPGDALVSGVPVSRTLLDLLVRNGNSAAGRRRLRTCVRVTAIKLPIAGRAVVRPRWRCVTRDGRS
jgi:hypothetical protein